MPSVQDVAARVVCLIAECIEHIRTIKEFGSGSLKKNEEVDFGNVNLFTQLKESNFVSQVEEISAVVMDTIPADEVKAWLPTDAKINDTNAELDYERFNLVHKVILPLLTALGRCYAVLDRMPIPPVDGEHSKRPQPPVGMLSLRNYTDIAALIELAVCSSIVPLVEPHILVPVEERVRYHLPKSLSGRIPRKSLEWASRRYRQYEPIPSRRRKMELQLVANVIGSLLRLDRFRPMLLPRHLADLYAAMLQAKELDENKTNQNQGLLSLDSFDLFKMDTDTVLQAKAYQSLLMHGTRAPIWLRKEVSKLLTDLASRDLPAIIQVFVHAAPKDSTAAGLRLARALVSGQHERPYYESLCDQLLSILDAVFQEFGSLGVLLASNLKPHHKANIHAVWAILDAMPANVRDEYLLGCIVTNMVPQNSSTRVVPTYRTVVYFGTLLSAVPPSSNPSILLRLLLSPLSLPGLPNEGLQPTTIGMLLRLASVSCVIKSRIKDDTVVFLRMLGQTFLASHFHLDDDRGNVRGADLFGVALVHALSPCLWDLAPFRFQIGTIEESTAEVIKIEQVDTAAESVAEIVVQEMEKRARVVATSVLASEDTDDQVHSLSSLVFTLLLRMYFASTNTNIHLAVPDLFRSPSFQLVPLACLPVICEESQAFSLLSSDPESDGIFEMMEIVFHSASRLIFRGKPSLQPRFCIETDLPRDQRLETATSFFASFFNNVVSTGSLLIDTNVSVGSDEIILSVASLLLSILVSVLELGARRRSQRDEDRFRSFVPLLTPLSELSVEDRSESSMSSVYAELAEMASHAIALVASRNAVEDYDDEHPVNDVEKPRTISEKLAQARQDLESKDPPIRARGVVRLRHLAIGCTADSKNLDLGLSNNETESLLKRLLSVSISALGDVESYVYLAAIHSIAAIADASPSLVLPLLGRAVASGMLPDTGPPATQLTREQRIKLAEALIFAIRRRGSIHEYVPFLMECLMFGPRDTNNGLQEKPEDAILIQRHTHNYILKRRVTDECDDEALSSEKMWDEIDVRAKAGGPLFLSEEDDTVRASLLNVISELIAASHPAVIARFASTIIDSSTAALRLDTSRPVRRSGANLARELYSALLREEESLGPTCKEIPLAIALVAGGEDNLQAALDRCCSSADLDDLGPEKKRLYDPATVARCQEALGLRKQADDNGILSAGRLALEDQRQQATDPISRLLKKSSDVPVQGRKMIKELD